MTDVHTNVDDEFVAGLPMEFATGDGFRIGVEGHPFAEGVIDLDAPIEENISAIAKEKGVPTGEVTLCILDRERHQPLIDGARKMGARVFLISDGDVAGVFHTTEAATGIDLYIGRGGAPEGVLAAAALRCVGGQMQGRLHFRTDDERE